MYPSYKPREVLEEYAITFIGMLNEGYRQRYERYYMLANIASITLLTSDSREKFLKQLEWASTDPSDILKPSDDYSGITDLKEVMRKL